MYQYTRISCPHCPRKLNIRAEYIDKWVICNHCNHPFKVAPETGKFLVGTTAEFTAYPTARAADGPPPGLAGGPPAAHQASGESGAGGDPSLGRFESTREMAEEIARLEGDQQILRDESRRLRVTVDGLRAHLAARTKDVARLSRANEEIGAARAEVERLEAELAEAERVRGRVAVLDAALAKAEARHAAASADHARHLQDAAAHREAEREALIREVEARVAETRAECEGRLRAELGPLEQERAALRAELADLRGLADLLRRERDELIGKAEEFRRARDTAANRHAEAESALEKEREGRRAEIVSLRDRIEALRREADAARADRDRARGEAEWTTADLDRARQEHLAAVARGDALADQVQQLREEIVGHQRGREGDRQEHRLALEALRAELEAAAAVALGRASDEARGLRAEIEAFRTESDRAGSERDEARRLADDLHRERTLFSERFAAIEQDRDRLAGAHTEAAAEVSRLMAHLADVERSLAGAQGESERSRGRIADLERSLAEVDAMHQIALADHARQLEEADASRVAELSDLSERWARERRALDEEIEQRVADERACHEARHRAAVKSLERDRDQHRSEADALRDQASKLAYECREAIAAADAARQDRERHHAESARLALELDHARSHLQDLAALHLEVEDRLRPAAPAAAETPRETTIRVDRPQPAVPSPDRAPDARPVPEPADDAEADFAPGEEFRALRNHLRTIHQAEEQERVNKRLFPRLKKMWGQTTPQQPS